MTRPTIRIYDNGGKTFDRYTVVFMNRPYAPNSALLEALAMSEDPFHPQGFGQHCSAMTGRHLGKRIKFEDLPEPCQRFLKQNMKPERDFTECDTIAARHFEEERSS